MLMKCLDMLRRVSWAALLILAGGCRTAGRDIGYDDLRAGFVDIPDTMQTSVYWHWLAGNISEEGVVADLEAMKKAGIDRAFIANIGLTPQEVPTGDVRLLSDEWWRILHAALKRAAELDIEIGIFNSAGWSQAGGPWIAPEQAMRRLTDVRRHVTGGGPVRVELPRPSPEFQDVKVLAWPSTASRTTTLGAGNCRIESSPALPGIGNLLDGDEHSEVRFAPGSVAIDFRTDSLVTLRSIRCLPSHAPVFAQAVLSVECGGEFEELTRFRIDRRRDRLDVGFDPYAAVAVSFPAAAGSRFRLELSGLTAGSGLREVVLSSEPVVDRYEEKTFAKMFQEPLPYWKEYQWPAAADTASTVRLGQVLDLSDRLAGDTLCWDAPAGEWEILRTGMVPTGVTNFPALEGDGLGLEVDKMSRTHLQAHFDAFVSEILRRIPARDRRTWRVVVADSYEVGGQNFTDDFLASFERRYGYSAVPFLPVFDGVVVESPDASDRFLWDVRRLAADRLAYDHVGELTRLCRRHGLTTWLENYGHWGFMGEFLQYGGQADEVAGEFWSEGDLGNVENRAASSCAHIYGKQKVSSESFTCGGAAYSRYPRLMKQRGDRFFAEGINNTLLHVCISQKPEYRRPGLNTWYGNEFNRNNTWYAQLDLFTDYLKRCNFLLQQGLDVADVCYFIGEDTPKMTGIVQPALPRGYQFDYVNAEVILRDMTVRDGRWTLPHGTSYRLLVLPELKTMRPELLDKLERLVAEGGVLLGPRPERSPSYENYPQADERVRTTAARLWGDADGKRSPTGQGMVLCGMEMPEALAAVDCLPDCAVPDDCPVVYAHRRTGGIDLYFLANQSSEKIAFPATFRVAGRQPELWEPASGRIRPLTSFEAGEETTSVPLELEPLESVFVVFARPASEPAGPAAANYPAPRVVTEVSGPWTLTFDAGFGGPAEPLLADTLFDWSRSPVEAVKYYSGPVVYRADFHVDERSGGPLFVDLGEVMVMARVRVNGEDVGGVWTAPYRLDITRAVRPGVNTLEVEVVNTWVNRLIGDCALPAEERTTWSPCNPWSAASPLQRAGLLGPVVVEEIEYESYKH